MKIKKIKTKEDAAAFLDGIEPGKPFCFESRGRLIEIELIPSYKITEYGESFTYGRQSAILMDYDWKGGINQALKRIAAAGRR